MKRLVGPGDFPQKIFISAADNNLPSLPKFVLSLFFRPCYAVPWTRVTRFIAGLVRLGFSWSVNLEIRARRSVLGSAGGVR